MRVFLAIVFWLGLCLGTSFAQDTPDSAPVIGEPHEGPMFLCLEQRDIELLAQADMDGTLDKALPAAEQAHKCVMAPHVVFRIAKIIGSYESEKEESPVYITMIEIQVAPDEWLPAYTVIAVKPVGGDPA